MTFSGCIILSLIDGEEQFLVIQEGKAKDTETLETCKELLETTKPLVPLLDRNAKVHIIIIYFKPYLLITDFTHPRESFKNSFLYDLIELMQCVVSHKHTH